MPPGRLSLKALVLRGSAWTLVGHGASMLVKLASSLILTRLLFPEVYGVMSLVWTVLFGLVMFSDVGLQSAIIRDPRGDDPTFLNTAWTLQIVRGLLLWAASCIIAKPMADFYGHPDLASLVPVAGLSAVLDGFCSMSLISFRRHMDFKKITLLEVSTQIIGFISTAIWALLEPTAWAIVGGTLISNLFKTIVSHLIAPAVAPRLRWDIESLKILFGFGKWIFFGSALYFLSAQLDRLLLGRFLDMSQLGIYSIAIVLIEAAQTLVLKLNHGILFPAYSKIFQTEPARLYATISRARIGIDFFLVTPLAMLMILGDWVVGHLYDVRYHEAGWMFQVLCLRPLMVATLSNSEACLVTLGKPQYAFIQNLGRAAWISVAIPLGWTFGGIQGVVWAVALSELPVMVVLWVGLVKSGMFEMFAEIRTVIFAGIGISMGYGILKLIH